MCSLSLFRAWAQRRFVPIEIKSEREGAQQFMFLRSGWNARVHSNSSQFKNSDSCTTCGIQAFRSACIHLPEHAISILRGVKGCMWNICVWACFAVQFSASARGAGVRH